MIFSAERIQHASLNSWMSGVERPIFGERLVIDWWALLTAERVQRTADAVEEPVPHGLVGGVARQLDHEHAGLHPDKLAIRRTLAPINGRISKIIKIRSKTNLWLISTGSFQTHFLVRIKSRFCLLLTRQSSKKTLQIKLRSKNKILWESACYSTNFFN